MSLLWWRYDKIRLTSPRDPEDCLQRLREACDSESLFARSRSDVVARIGERSFRTRKHQSILSRNPFVPMVYGSVAAARAGTRIDCRVGPQRLVIALFILWMFLPCVAFVDWFITGVVAHEPVSVLMAIVSPEILMALTSLVFSLFRWAARKDAEFLLDFLAMILDAREGEELPRYSLAAAEQRARVERTDRRIGASER